MSGAAVLVLGFVLWSGHAPSLVSVHMTLGVILVLALWALAGLALRTTMNRATIAIAVAWGFVVPLLGVVQLALPSGGGYQLVRVLHLFVGLGAMAQAESLARPRAKG